MNRAVEDVVLAPFGDIVSHGKAAISNAEDIGDEEMSRAAGVLVKEGERALKRLEPVCRKLYEEYGSNFVDALMDNGIRHQSPFKFHIMLTLAGTISELTEELNDFLYDFEDYVEADKFDTNRYSELYALSRKAAPRILHIVTRMKLESPQCQDSTTSPITESVSPFTESPLPYPEGPEADGQIYDALRHVAKLDIEPEKTPAEVFKELVYPEDDGPSSSLVPSPWSYNCHIPKERPDRTAHRRGTTSGPEVHSGHSLYPIPAQISVSFPPVPPRSPARRSNTYYDNKHLGPESEFAAASVRYQGNEGILGSSPYLQTRGSIGSSTVVSSQISVSDHHRGRDSCVDIVSPVSAADGDSMSSERHVVSLQVPPLFSRSAAESRASSVSGSYGPEKLVQDVPDGLIPVDDETIEPCPPVPSRPPPAIPEDCNIALDSSFYHFKGFCKGSMEIIQGGLGVRRIKKQVSPVLTHDDVQPHAHSSPGSFRRIQGGR